MFIALVDGQTLYDRVRGEVNRGEYRVFEDR